MHRSRIGVILLDFPEDTFEVASTFWSVAVGEEPVPQQGDPDYASLGRLSSLKLELQRTGLGTPARAHLDIETDNVAAEVARLLAAGATIETEFKHFTVLRDPAGMVFCVVPVQTGDAFESDATEWP